MEDRYGLKAASDCDNIIREYCRGSRPNAKKSLKQIAKQTASALPRRYLARLIYHEAAGSISPGTVGSGSSMKRIQLLQEAYEHAMEATNLAPNSLSCAALRATLAINLLVEESALLNPSNKPAKKGQGMSALEKKCQELRERFRGSIDACRTALEHSSPVMVEPVITMITATHTTCDPCSLLQEKILDWFKNGNWQEIVAEKRSVLTSMQQVLQSCYALLDSTQVPVNSIIKLLQHILRPDGSEQQMLASSRVGSGAAAGQAPSDGTQLQLPTAQLHHAAIGELLRLLRPASGSALPATAAADCDAPQAAAAPAADTELAPLPLSVEKPWGDAKAASTTAAPKAAAGAAAARGKGSRGSKGRATAAAGALKKKERTRRERFMDVESFWRSCSPEQRMQLLQVPLAPLLEDVKQQSGSEAAEELMEGLVLLREQTNTSARYWLCAACDRKFHTASDFSAHLEACHEQLVLIKQAPQQQQQQQAAASMMYRPGHIAAAIASGAAAAGGASATSATAAGTDAASAVEAAVAAAGPNSILAQAAQVQQQQQQVQHHPQQQLQPVQLTSISGQVPLTYVTCSKCQCEVVGMYFSSVQPPPQQQQQPPPAQPHQLCLKCYRLVSASIGAAKAGQSYTRVAPHAPVLGCSAWSESGSEFISTRDSFSSCDVSEDEVVNDLDSDMMVAHLGNRHPPLKLPGTKGQLTAQQQRQLAWLSAAVNRGMSSGTIVHAQQQQLAQQEQVQQQQLAQQEQVQQQQQQQRRQEEVSQPAPAPAPGMFVFSSKGPSSSNTTSGAAAAVTAPRQPAALARPAAPLLCTVGPGAAGVYSGADTLSHELIAELEAVHAARRVLLQGQPAAAAPPLLQQAVAYSQQAQQRQHQAGSAAASSGTALPALALVGTGRQPDTASDSNASSSSAASAAAAAAATAGQDLGTPTASGRTWRDWLLPKKLLQWSEGEEGHESAGLADQDDVHLGRREAHMYSSDVEHTDSAARLSLHRRHSDSTSGGAARSSSRRQQWQQGQGQGGPAAGVSSSSAPCSPRTPAGKDSRQQQQGEAGADDAGGAAVAACTVQLELSENCSALARAPSMLSNVSRAAAVPGGCLPEAHPPAVVNVAAAALAQQRQRTECSSINAAAAQADACMAVAGQRVLVDEIIRCMAQVYAADKDVADMTLGCLVDFVRRKLVPPGSVQTAAVPAASLWGPGSAAEGDRACYLSSSSSPAAGSASGVAVAASAAAAATHLMAPNSRGCHAQLPVAAALLPAHELQLVQQFLASPEAAYLSPDMMHATLCCLPASDLQMALAYVVRQHEDTMTQPGHSDSEADTSSQSVIADDDAGCMPLFQLHHLDELSFEQLVEHIWPGELDDGPEAAAPTSGASAAAHSGASKGGAGTAGKGGKTQQPRQKQISSAAAQRSADPASSATAALVRSKPMQDQPKLLPASWWVEHLQQSSKAADPPAVAAGDHRILRWVYGNIVSSQAEEFAAGQAALRCNLDRHTALLELYEGMANAWRRMQRVADKRRVLEQLRQNIKTQFGVVRSQEEAGEHCTGQQAVTFLEALFTSLCTNSSGNSTADKGNASSTDDQSASLTANSEAATAAAAIVAPATGTWPGSVGMLQPSLCLSVPAPGASQTQPEPPGLATQVGPDSQATAAAAAGAASVAAAQNAAVSQLQVRLNQLAPLYLCEPAVEVVRQAPALAREASQRYARALLERELSVLALIEAMLDDDVQAARQKLAGANDRLVARRSELSTAEAEHSRLVTEGPASHRKKDFLDKATKEAEHREKLADLKVKVDAAKAAIAEDEVTAAAADLAAADATGDLARVREQARQIAARKKNLEDLNTQLSAPVPPLTEAALAAAVSSSAATAGAGLGMLPGPGAAAAAALAAAASGSSGCSCCPPLPAGTPALRQPTITAVTTTAAAGSSTVGTDPAAISTAAELGWSWRAQRLECLMYRVLWVAEAVKLFQAQYEPRGKQYELLVRASKWVKERCDEYDLTFQAAAEDLSNMRNRVQQLACVDLTFDINEAALKYIRKAIETEAARAQELRSQTLLLELAAEEEAKKAQQAAQQQHADAAASGSGGIGGSTTASGTPGKSAKGKKGKQSDKQASSKDQLQKQQQQLSEHERKAQELAAKQALEEARRAREAALEAELEQRRRELEQLEAQQEAELIKQAQEASLKEQQALKRAQEASRLEQQALADAAAVLAAAAGSGDMSVLQGSSTTGGGGGGSGAAGGATSSKGPQPGKGQKAGGKAAVSAATGPAANHVGAAAANHVGQRGKGQQQQYTAVFHQPPPPPPPPATASKPASRPGAASRAAGAVLHAPTAPATAAPAAAAGMLGKAAAAAAPATPAAASKQQRAAQQQHAQLQAAVGTATGHARKTGKHVITGPGAAATAAAPSAASHHAGKQQQQQYGQHPAPPPAAASGVPHAQPSQEPAPSMLDFGPTPAEAYAAAAATKEQQTPAAASKEQQVPPPPPPPRKHAAGQAAEAEGAASNGNVEGSHVAGASPFTTTVAQMSTQAVAVPTVKQEITQGAPACSSQAAAVSPPAVPAPGPGLSTRDEVVHMPASGAGSSSHLSLLSMPHPLDAGDAGAPAAPSALAGQPGSLTSSSSGVVGMGGLGGLGLTRSAGSMPLPLSMSLHGTGSDSGAHSMRPLLSGASSGSSFDPFGGSYGPPDALLLQQGSAFGVQQQQQMVQAGPSSGGQQQQQPGCTATLKLQSAGSAPLDADLGAGSAGLGARLTAHQFGGQSVAAGMADGRQPLDLAAATGPSSSGSTARSALPPQPATACSNLMLGPPTAGPGAAHSAHAAFGALEPGSPLQLGSSPADAPHIQSIMSLLDGDTGLSSSQQQQQQQAAEAARTSSCPAPVKQQNAKGGANRPPGSTGRDANNADGQRQQQQRPRASSPSAVSASSWDGPPSAPGSHRSSGGAAAAASGPMRGMGPAGTSSEQYHQPQQQGHLTSPPGLRAGSQAGAGARAGETLPPRPGSANSSTSAENVTGYSGQQQQQQLLPQAWLQQQQQLGGYGGVAWGSLAPGADAASMWGAPVAGVQDRRSSSGGQQQLQLGNQQAKPQGTPVATPTATAAAGGRQFAQPISAAGQGAARRQAQQQQQQQMMSSVASSAPFGATAAAAAAAVSPAGSSIGSTQMALGGSPGFPTQGMHLNAASLAAAAAAAATAAVTKARQQAAADAAAAAAAMAFGDAGFSPYTAGPGLGGVETTIGAGLGTSAFGVSRNVLAAGAGGGIPMGAASSGFGGYPGAIGVSVPGFGTAAAPGVLSSHMDGRPGVLGQLGSPQGAFGVAGAAAGSAAGASSLWGWQQGGNPQQQQAAAAAMAAAMHQQQQQQMLAGRGAVVSAGMPGLWQPLQQQPQQQAPARQGQQQQQQPRC